jgi:hypothetical protein
MSLKEASRAEKALYTESLLTQDVDVSALLREGGVWKV